MNTGKDLFYMPPVKLFISYRSVDSAKVDAIVARLASLKETDGTPRYIAWQDKTGIPAAKDWWEAIVDAIIDCDVFVFHISQEALKSDVCRAELSYARKRNRPIIPVVLEGEYVLNERTGKHEISYWQDIPAELNDLRAQFLFYEGASFFDAFERSVAMFLRDASRWRDIPAPRPGDPREGSETAHDGIALYDEACDYAGRMEFSTSEKLFQKLVNRNDPDFATVAFEWIEMLRQYERLVALDSKASTRFRVRSAWDAYQKLFPKDFLEGIFDPKGFEARFTQPAVSEVVIEKVSDHATSSVEDQQAASIARQVLEKLDKNSKPKASVQDVLPGPFAWVEIPVGHVILEEGGYVPTGGQSFYVPAFAIAKYPITNGQYTRFIEAGGYREKRWWSEAGWHLREKEQWSEPRYWRAEKWNKFDYPVIGVSWYESIAFCQWLSEMTSETILLPTEQQWQRAAQGDDQRLYPWGNEWNENCCNNSVKPLMSNQTTSVRQYEEIGASPYGVVDMAGNTWEWCATNWSEVSPSEKTKKLIRGSSWDIGLKGLFSTGSRVKMTAEIRNLGIGFRCVRL